MKKLLAAAAPYLTLVVLSLLYCAPLFSGLDCSGRGDWDQFTFRRLTPRLAMLRDRELPLWIPYVNGGNVLLAHPHSPAFSPWYLLTLIFGAELGVRLEVVLLVVLGTTGMAALLRQWNVSRAGSVLGGLLLMMGAHFTLHVAEGHVEWCALGLVPWAVLCLLQAEKNWRYLPAGAAVIAAALLDGSVYILAVFFPVLVLWSVLESIRTRSWHAAARMTGMWSLALLLGAVVLLPRAEFVAANPRPVDHINRVDPAALPAMLLDPGQADLFRGTRDVVNPPRKELDRCLHLPSSDPEAGGQRSEVRDQTSDLRPLTSEGWQWRRLDVELSTTSDWADVRFSGVTYILRFGKDTVENLSSEQLDETAPSTEGLAIKNNPVSLATRPDVLVEEIPDYAQGTTGQPRRAVLQAALYVHRSRWNSLHVSITRGDEGQTRLILRHAGTIVADLKAAGRIAGDRTNRQTYDLTMQELTSGGKFRGKWVEIQVRLRTTSDWARLEIPGMPCLLAVEDPVREAAKLMPLAMQPLELHRPSPGSEIVFTRAIDGVLRSPGLLGADLPGTCARVATSLTLTRFVPESFLGLLETDLPQATASARAILCVPYPENDDLHLLVHQGAQGRSRLTLATARGLLSVVRDERPGEKGERIVDYTLSRVAIQDHFEPMPKPWRWQLDEWEMTDGWHEYACYLTWAGLALAICGGVVIARRHWPLLAVGGVAALIAMGEALPVNLWSIVARLPFYGSLQVSARFLTAAVFVAAVCAGFGLDWLGRRAERFQGPLLRHLVEGGALLIVYVELALLAWSIFPEIFVCRLDRVPAHETFAQRYATDDVHRAAMYSAHCPYARANSGVLRDYENIAVPRGEIRLEGNPAYRGEAYLQDGHGTARIARWTMSRVTVDTELTDTDQLVLNQNFFTGWKAAVRTTCGTCGAMRRPVYAKDGLVAVALQPGITWVEFYYLPDSFLWGAWISVLTAVGCLGACLSLKANDWTAGFAAGHHVLMVVVVGWLRGLARSRAAVLAAAVVGLNLPFLLCHPAWPLVNLPAVRALAVALVLLVLPGWPLAALLVRRGWLARGHHVGHHVPMVVVGPVAMIALSMSVFVALIVAVHVGGIAPQPARLWNATWIIANLGFLAVVVQPSRLLGQAGRLHHVPWLTLPVFVATFLMYFHAATSIVPHMDDHDFETQGTAYGLVHDLVPKLLTDRHTTYYFAHPPLLHACVAGSFLYWNELDDLQYYEAAWKRNQTAAGGGLTEKAFDEEVQLIEDAYHRDPHALATRTPNIFFAALTVALLAAWIARTTGRWWLALLVSAAYATSPETFVRSGYGGYFAISQLALLEILLATEMWNTRFENSPLPPGMRRSESKDSPLPPGEGQGARAVCLLAGGFAALACHKLVFLPAAVFLCAFLAVQQDAPSPARRFLRAVLHPVVLGFVLGTLLYWIYGLSINPGVFWLDHVRTHLVDRVTHYNPLGYHNYPSPMGLWVEFWRHTGYLLLPLGIAAMASLAWRGWRGHRKVRGQRSEIGDQNGLRLPTSELRTPNSELVVGSGIAPGLRSMAALWIVWSLLLAIAFTAIDWRQTKHLSPLLLPLVMAPAAWAGTNRLARYIVVACMAVLLLWNLGTLSALAADFKGFHVSPDW